MSSHESFFFAQNDDVSISSSSIYSYHRQTFNDTPLGSQAGREGVGATDGVEGEGCVRYAQT